MRVNLILPPGRHSWNLGQGWAETLHTRGQLGKVIQATPENVAEVLALGQRPDADVILLMGGDHHLMFLHDTPAKRAVWQGCRAPTVCLCYESIIDTRFPGSVEKSRASRQAFSHFLVCDEKDQAFFEALGAPVEWMPQCVDPVLFHPGSERRRAQTFFRGKSDLGLHYEERAALIQQLSEEPGFRWFKEEVDDTTLASLYRQHFAALNPPGNFFGYNVRTFEALASGCLLLQSRVADRPRNNALLGPDCLIEFDPIRPEVLKQLIREVVVPSSEADWMIRRGREACLAAHTINHRLDQLRNFVERSWRQTRQLHVGCGGNLLPGFVNIDARATDPRVVVQDAGQLETIAEGQATRIYACHILEHFPRAQLPMVLSNWRRRLAPGGELLLSVPDFRYLSFFYLFGRRLSQVLPPLFGGQDYAGNFHHTAFDYRLLAAELRGAGFVSVETFDPYEYPFTAQDCSRWALSLNVRAVAPGGPSPVWQPVRRSLKKLWLTLRRYGQGLLRLHP
jgi:predicted SAM-dependent methyltransferase